MVYPWDVNFGIWYIPFYIQWMYGEYPNYLPLDVLWGISEVRPKLFAVGMIIPIAINKLGIFQLLFFPYFSLRFTILNSFY
jgi:hypothetical protein